MLSILILSYDYDLYSLVIKLQNECCSLGLEFEILCSDDNSKEHFRNNSIGDIDNCHYIKQSANIGRSRTRNFLIDRATYDTVIMIDSDTYPVTNNFVANYLSIISKNEKAIISGGLKYKNEKPRETELLRWVYGQAREAIPAKKRQLNPYKYTLCSNICFNKNHLNGIGFPQTVHGYGYEDFVFFRQLEKENREIIHLDNAVFHLKLDTSTEFLDKTVLGIRTLKQLLDDGIVDSHATLLSRSQIILKKLHFQKIFHYFFKKYEPMIKANLISNNPKIHLLDIYKLGKLNEFNIKH